ncbi:MAG TPA: UbiA family prenyltransferase [Candidatus Acidoferrales bacterium]|nr:UbiA family prenyltransferase [Candidatus Acidoferrales bacterium]
MDAPVKRESHDSHADNVPLVVDLDGTLLCTDLFQESTLRLIKQKPWLLLVIPFWLFKGRAFLKRWVFQRVRIETSLLPLNKELLAWLKEEKAQGRRLILATASDYDQARSVVEPLGLFDTVMGSDGRRNLKGRNKLQSIVEQCGGPFDYAGNSSADLKIWRGCRQAVLVNAPRRVENAARRAVPVARVFSPPAAGLWNPLRAMRWHQWVKNLLVFVPAITSHTIFHAAIAGRATLAFLSFCFCASAAYILNDLLDLEEDRRHSTKTHRPFAAGRTSIGTGLLLALLCLCASAAIAVFLPLAFMTGLGVYFGLTCLYSLYLKRLLAVDVLTLALLYTLRVVAGSLATGIVLSLWLLSFAFFLFLSLAFGKRTAELMQQQQNNRKEVPGRGYVISDLDAVSTAGICSGFLAALILALYTNSDSVQLLYRRPVLLWGLQPVLLYYVTRFWVICKRGDLMEDPIQYTVREPSTYGAASLAVLVLLAATFDFPLFGW